jgi:hypothetical protein
MTPTGGRDRLPQGAVLHAVCGDHAPQAAISVPVAAIWPRRLSLFVAFAAIMRAQAAIVRAVRGD